jgi:hypothetical protein
MHTVHPSAKAAGALLLLKAAARAVEAAAIRVTRLTDPTTLTLRNACYPSSSELPRHYAYAPLHNRILHSMPHCIAETYLGAAHMLPCVVPCPLAISKERMYMLLSTNPTCCCGSHLRHHLNALSVDVCKVASCIKPAVEYMAAST